jgi:hypothetical protein
MPRHLCLASLAFAILSYGFGQELEAQEETGRFSDKKSGFSFVPPAGWERSHNLPHPALQFMYLGPTYRGFRANVNMSADKDNGESFELLSTQAKAMYAKMFPTWEATEEGPVEIDGKATYVLSGAYRGGPHRLRLTQFFVRGNGKVYILTFTTASDAFERLKHDMVRSAMSIKLE